MASERSSEAPQRTCAAVILITAIRFFQISLSTAEIAVMEVVLHDFTHPKEDSEKPWQTLYALSTATISTLLACGLLGLDFVQKRNRWALRVQIGLELAVTVLWAVAALVLDMQADDEIYDNQNNTAASLRNPSIGLASAAAVIFFFSPFITGLFCQRRPATSSSSNRHVSLSGRSPGSTKQHGLRALLKSPELGFRKCELRAQNGALKVVPKVRDFANEPSHNTQHEICPSPELGLESPKSLGASTEDVGIAYTELEVVRFNVSMKLGEACNSEMGEIHTIESEWSSTAASRKASSGTLGSIRKGLEANPNPITSNKVSLEAPSQRTTASLYTDAKDGTVSPMSERSKRASNVSSVHTAPVHPGSRSVSPIGVAQ